jgi:hypothetical protein
MVQKMDIPKTYKEVIARFKQAPDEIQKYFTPSVELIERYPWEVTLAYMFSRIELAHNMTLYCGVVKLHRAHSEVAWSAIDSLHITRNNFRELFETVFGKPLKSKIIKKISEAEAIRDKIMHGKDVPNANLRKAIFRLIKYTELFNDFVFQAAGFKPFGSLRGFKGRAEPLDKSTTMWLLKGIKILS